VVRVRGSRIRAGARIPYTRHWKTLQALVGGARRKTHGKHFAPL
jgi:hypothetical protein